MNRPPPSPRKRWPLWQQLVLAMLAALLLVNLLTAPLARLVVSEYLFKQEEEQTRSSFTLLAATVIDAVITKDIPLLDSIAAQSMEQAPNMVVVSIENELGELLVRRSQVDTATTGRMRNYSNFIEFDGERFGTINIQWDMEPVHQEIDRHVTELQLFISTTLVLLTGVIVILVHWFTIRPIHQITR